MRWIIGHWEFICSNYRPESKDSVIRNTKSITVVFHSLDISHFIMVSHNGAQVPLNEEKNPVRWLKLPVMSSAFHEFSPYLPFK